MAFEKIFGVIGFNDDVVVVAIAEAGAATQLIEPMLENLAGPARGVKFRAQMLQGFDGKIFVVLVVITLTEQNEPTGGFHIATVPLPLCVEFEQVGLVRGLICVNDGVGPVVVSESR